jgi:hypothetical protein
MGDQAISTEGPRTTTNSGDRHTTSARQMVSGTRCDVFLAHNSSYKPKVKIIADALRKRGLRPWIDDEQIPPGRWFAEVIENAVLRVRAAAIFVGRRGLGPWQRIELHAFVSHCIDREIPVIPVLLPGLARLPKELVFLRQLSSVRFIRRIDEQEPLDLLEWGIRGRARTVRRD